MQKEDIFCMKYRGVAQNKTFFSPKATCDGFFGKKVPNCFLKHKQSQIKIIHSQLENIHSLHISTSDNSTRTHTHRGGRGKRERENGKTRHAV